MSLITKYRYSLAVITGILFLLGTLASAYQIFLAGLETLVPLLTIILTGFLGVIAILLSMGLERQVIVYRDRSESQTLAQQEEQQFAASNMLNINQISTILGTNPDKSTLQKALTYLCDHIQAGQGALYQLTEIDSKSYYELTAGYALNFGESKVVRFESGEGLVGQAAKSGRELYIDNVPKGYITILSGLGSSSPQYLYLVPVVHEQLTRGLLEIATFHPLSEETRKSVSEAAALLINALN